MGDAVPLPNDALNALIEYIKEQGPYVLASPEDADYFRKAKYKPEAPKAEEKKPEAALPPKPVVKHEVPPKPIAIAPPVINKEEPPPPAKPSFDLSSVRHILSVVAPELAIINEIPNDSMARKISERWKTKNQSAPISILVYQEPPEQRALLTEVARALEVYFGSAKIVQAEGIEKDKQWGAFLSVPDLKMVIVCDYTLWQLNGLMQFYKETPAQGTRVLGNVPIFLLPDLSLYLKDSLLKRSLWKALCQKFS
jgi:hypothetical protein